MASVDFPFSVPQRFANVLAGSPKDMADVWAGVADMSMEEFIALRDTFVAETRRDAARVRPQPRRGLFGAAQGQPKHASHDTAGHANAAPVASSGMCASSAKTRPAQPNSPCWSACPAPPSRASASPTRPTRTAASATSYADASLDGLASAVPVPLANVEEVGEQCLAVHDALDAVVAALNSAVYMTCAEAVSTPPERRHLPAGRGGFITSSQYSDRQGRRLPAPLGILFPFKEQAELQGVRIRPLSPLTGGRYEPSHFPAKPACPCCS